MLLSSILWLLDQPQLQTKLVEKTESGFRAELAAAKKQLLGLGKIKSEMAAAAELVKSLCPEVPRPEKPVKGSNLEELLRTITKFEKSDQSRGRGFLRIAPILPYVERATPAYSRITIAIAYLLECDRLT